MRRAAYRNRRLVLAVQSVYYLVTGIWPLVHINSFMAVTGPKAEFWLVRTVGTLIVCIALVLLLDLLRRELSSAAVRLGLSCAIGLLLVDVYYSLAGVISKVYLADALLQLVLIIMWCVYLFRKKDDVVR
jgi:hypothetical protein